MPGIYQFYPNLIRTQQESIEMPPMETKGDFHTEMFECLSKEISTMKLAAAWNLRLKIRHVELTLYTDGGSGEDLDERPTFCSTLDFTEEILARWCEWLLVKVSLVRVDGSRFPKSSYPSPSWSAWLGSLGFCGDQVDAACFPRFCI